MIGFRNAKFIFILAYLIFSAILTSELVKQREAPMDELFEG